MKERFDNMDYQTKPQKLATLADIIGNKWLNQNFVKVEPLIFICQLNQTGAGS